MTATRFAKASTLVALAVGWLVAAWLLTRTTVPGNLHAPHVDAGSVFPAGVLHRTAHYDGFLRWLWVAATLATLGGLVLFVYLGPRIARAWELGRVATGVMVGAVVVTATGAGVAGGVAGLGGGAAGSTGLAPGLSSTASRLTVAVDAAGLAGISPPTTSRRDIC